MLPNFKICDCCGAEIRLDDNKIHTDLSEHQTHIQTVKVGRDIVYGVVDFIVEKSGFERTTVTHSNSTMKDICPKYKLKFLEAAIEQLKKHEL